MLGPIEDTLPEMTRALADALKSVPVAVYYGKERFSRNIVTSNRIEITEVGPELFRTSMGTRADENPSVGERTIAVQALIEAHDDRASASEGDHKRLANWFADLVFAGFLELGQERGEIVESWAASGGFTDQTEDELSAGAKYVLSFSLGRSVKRLSAMLQDGGSLVSAGTLKVTTAGGTPETVCE